MGFDLSLVGYGALIGLSLGLTGSGGSILAIPLLVYGAKMPVQQALVISLLVVACIAAFGAIRQTLDQKVNWVAAFQFSLAGMIVSPITVGLTSEVNETFRVGLFALLMLVAAWSMLRPASFLTTKPPGKRTRLSTLLLINIGGAISGIMAGFFGVGGGFIIVPFLNLIFAMPYATAVGTSLASIAMISLTSLAGHLIESATLDIGALIPFILGGALGLLIGTSVINRLPDQITRVLFASVTASLAIFMLIDIFL
ncbi:sulfite exporter TauE/SafE family protein [Estrella lausannensis]|uniref:Probable membrane transporter protein n=1 Tax=Estrella lausannensis TaxID=483423 RepID=A0A0H5DRK3_9BACT|nr:sulfite exporter TauE/SafE family protein [Estrella lausannensis]CRX39331.1 putative membrane protein [Estrella lausannensis]